ncbi:amino acid ABC transporter membrane protein 1, PAAT family (TC 3.A.1.3.-) [Pseudoxanthobacter soli DSM 19599]|uniref:Amino acid ABC transporter membrane protein 1, PAAT family (TC 3.A.1.3.-) n=1 Tax=Pseudoxanthobacter soli DSM 19599 TaxID=1123029 RepID=A0A1M7ZPM6_9HYPH|nr:amino acid ABC transporter permease [Pseudoxanthobacter soli]SHO66759.1 amino acid ABC transporter membrane protein 1, PAAT family (TC 3.A.1.3.-) [Pseudoxanthobacter soli DSM 19599]
MNYTFQYGVVLDKLPYLLDGAVLTLEIAFLSFWLGAVIGLAGALAKVYGGRILKGVINVYVVFFTNTPALVQIFFLFYALPDAGILLSPMTAVVMGLTVNSGAYLTEILRGGLLSVRREEIETAQVLGMSGLQTVRYVMLPHIAKTIYAPLSNFFIWLVLGSSLASIFGVEELTGRAVNISTQNLRTIETFSVVAVIYVVLTFVASIALALVGRWAFRVRARIF